MVSDGAMAKNTQELQDLMIRQPIDRKAGTMGGGISKRLIFGRNQIPETEIQIAG